MLTLTEERSNIMAENVEFVNAYIDKLNKSVHDLTGRNVVLETRLEMSEKVIAQLTGEIENYKNELVARSKQIDQMDNDNRHLRNEVSDLRVQLAAANKLAEEQTAAKAEKSKKKDEEAAPVEVAMEDTIHPVNEPTESDDFW